MFESVKEGFTVLGVLKRLLVVLGRMERSLASLADTQAMALKLDLLSSGASLDELRATPFPSPEDVGDVDEQDEGDFAEMERAEMASRARGYRVDDDADLGTLQRVWLEAEEKRDDK